MLDSFDLCGKRFITTHVGAVVTLQYETNFEDGVSAHRLKRPATPNAFNVSWEEEFFLVESSGLAKCLIWHKTLQLIKKFNIQLHYSLQHATEYDKYAGNERHKLIQLKENVSQDDNNALSESAMRISYKICLEIAKELKTFNEGNFIKRCLIILADEPCPQQVGEVEAIRLSRRTVSRSFTSLPLDDSEFQQTIWYRCSRDANIGKRNETVRNVTTGVLNVRNVTIEEQRLRVFENKVLRKIFGAKRDEVTGEWRKLHNTELQALYSSPDEVIFNPRSEVKKRLLDPQKGGVKSVYGVNHRERANLLSNLDKRQNIQENKRKQRDGILLANYAISRL
ncbi:hypothetical protein ANN_24280 [Periplaneta americana]|uniref:Uncharacterized protein n=1 Tax=Periplaneta americana TaxID=6978 RepID=A0ABQ8S2N3_PERAM|nr:hypothetical protein ANN_24280 [Periplaneta americana]